jgi:hypothetical protein
MPEICYHIKVLEFIDYLVSKTFSFGAIFIVSTLRLQFNKLFNELKGFGFISV